ncbi:reactive intermediate/imine deaminase [Acuticoccus sediminis]|uniref:Reactive intermediate/imine deaminase n=1 Tax=Acuticoccus sediminis TaxID=2184697 RepID=A0A8B2P2I3_9HYPH|nr:RidA family protein [Acuticoccus sediminis]RAI04356.1 reactive intermediate/imine deaminase [Acuticoccus sediminis]
MLEITRIMVPNAPPPVAPFSHAVRAGDFLFVTGQMPTAPQTGELVGADVAAQTRQVVANLEAVLAGAGLGLDRVVFARVYLLQFDRDYADMNAVWAELFPSERRPGRTCVGVNGLALGALVEVDFVAAF